jgi:hypothetical protein
LLNIIIEEESEIVREKKKIVRRKRKRNMRNMCHTVMELFYGMTSYNVPGS